jgi:hypothetical protein
VPSATSAAVRPVSICVSKRPTGWQGLFATRSFALPTTQFLADAASPDGDSVFGFYRNATQQGIAQVSLDTGQLQTVDQLAPDAAGIIGMAYDPPWLAWAQGDAQENIDDWSVHARNLATGEHLDLATSRLPDGSVVFGQLPLPVVGHGLIGWAQPLDKSSGTPVTADLRIYRLSTHQMTTLATGRLSSPVFAGPDLVWGQLDADGRTTLRAVDAESLQPASLPDVVARPGPALYLAGSADQLVWSASNSDLETWNFGAAGLKAYTYTADISHPFQFLSLVDHFLLWYTGHGSTLLDLDTGRGVDVDGMLAGAGRYVVASEPIGKPAAKNGLVGTTVTRLDVTSNSRIDDCGG